MRKIDKRIIDKAVQEFRDFDFKKKVAFCVIYETYGNVKSYKMCDGQGDLRANFQAEIGDVVIPKGTLNDILNNFKANVDPDNKGHIRTTSIEEALKGIIGISILHRETAPSYMVRQLIIIHKTKD